MNYGIDRKTFAVRTGLQRITGLLTCTDEDCRNMPNRMELPEMWEGRGNVYGDWRAGRLHFVPWASRMKVISKRRSVV